jgi:hypothetical protein
MLPIKDVATTVYNPFCSAAIDRISSTCSVGNKHSRYGVSAWAVLKTSLCKGHLLQSRMEELLYMAEM